MLNIHHRGQHSGQTPGGNTQDNANGDPIPLPLNLVALIISFLDQSADLARACRTCRVLHYMTLPQLYAHVSLHSYDHVRFSPEDGRPEGYGAASPFLMGLNALVSRNISGYVKTFRVWGEWKEYDILECAKFGRVPDGTMMLSTLIRMAVEKMATLNRFSWELNTKILPILWQALAVKPNLTHLTIRFPTTRVPKPTMTVPSIPNLTYLRITDIDPLCYPDDISLILYGSKKLQDLTLHWNSHMREAREPSVTLSSYFGKVIAADERLPLRKFTVQNLYVHSNGEIRGVIDMSTLRECTIINCMDGHGDNGDAAFIDTSWLYHPSSNDLPCLTMLRVDSVSKAQGGQIAKLRGIEKIYMIGPRKGPEGTNASHIFTPAVSISDSPASGPQSATTSVSDLGTDTLAKHYIDNIIRGSGTTLLHLLLKPQWRLSSEKVATIVRHCPNLEQIGIGVEFSNFEALQLLMPFLSKLHAVRILDNPNHSAFSDSLVEFDDGRHEEFIRRGASISEWSNLRWVGLGNLVFELGPLISQKDMDGDGSSIYRRSVTKRSLDEVRHVEIWGMDSLDI